MSEDLPARYADLRRAGYKAWSAGIELRLSPRTVRAYERDYRAATPKTAPQPRRPAEPFHNPSRPATTAFYAERVGVDETLDDLHVAAVLRLGGFPCGTGKGWRGPDGRPWRARSARRAA